MYIHFEIERISGWLFGVFVEADKRQDRRAWDASTCQLNPPRVNTPKTHWPRSCSNAVATIQPTISAALSPRLLGKPLSNGSRSYVSATITTSTTADDNGCC